MNWTKKEMNDAAGDYRKHGFHPDVLRRIMTRAVELVAARGGTKFIQCTDCLRIRYDDGKNHCTACGDGGGRPVEFLEDDGRIFAAHGATVAALQADLDRVAANRAELVQAVASAVQARDTALVEVARYEDAARHDQAKYDALRAEVKRLTPLARDTEESRRATAKAWQEVERLKAVVNDREVDRALAVRARDRNRQRAETAESRLAAITEALDAIRDGRRFRGEYTPEAIAKAAFSLEGDAPNSPGIPDGSGETPETEYDIGDGPFTVTRYPCSPTCTHEDSVNPGHRERVKAQSVAVARAALGMPDAAKEVGEAFTKEAVLAFDGCQNDRERVCYAAGREGGLDEGAEAMRAACLTEVLDTCATFGLGPAFRDAVRKAIEGAAP